MHTRFLPLVLTLLFLGGPLAVPVYAQQDVPSQSVGLVPTDELSSDVKRSASTAVRGSDGQGKDGPLAAVGMELAVLYYQYREKGGDGVQALQQHRAPRMKGKSDPLLLEDQRVPLPISGNGAFVRVEAIASRDPSQLLAGLRDLGLRDGATVGNGVSGRLPVSAIAASAGLSSLRGMMPSYARSRAGSVISEADTAHRSLEPRATFGVTGRGQKVCALSDSYDNASATTSASDDVQSGDLPGSGNPDGRTTPVDVLDDSFDGVSGLSPSDEGRAMLQLIHDIAPGAELGFHTAFGGISDFARGIGELADAGCTVIVDDVGYSSEPFYQDGRLSIAIDEAVRTSDATYFSSAGNDGENSYEAPFRGSGQTGVLGGEAHDFDSSTSIDTRQEIRVGAGGTFRIFTFQWTDPSAAIDGSTGPSTDLDVGLVDQSGTVVASSTRDNINGGVPVESLEYTNNGSSGTTLDLVIERVEGPDPDEIKYVYAGQNFSLQEYDTGGPTVYGHPVAEEAMAVAAAPFFNTAAYNSSLDSSAVLEYFSSLGGIPILFDQNGTSISPVVRQKPEVTGVDFVDNTFFGTDIDLADPDPHPNFPGTSASAPNVAAVAALVREARPQASATDVYGRLESNSVDIRSRQKLRSDGSCCTSEPVGAGVDLWSGHGFVRADRAVPPPAGVQIVNLEDTVISPGTIRLRWSVVGPAATDAFVVQKQFFDGRLTEQARIETQGQRDFETQIQGLPVGRHTFRVSGVRNGDTLTTSSTRIVLRSERATVFAYPNPFRDLVNVSVTLPTDGGSSAVQIRVFDALGRRVSIPVVSRTVKDATAFRFTVGDLGILGAGRYFLRVEGQDFTKTVPVSHVP